MHDSVTVYVWNFTLFLHFWGACNSWIKFHFWKLIVYSKSTQNSDLEWLLGGLVKFFHSRWICPQTCKILYFTVYKNWPLYILFLHFNIFIFLFFYVLWSRKFLEVKNLIQKINLWKLQKKYPLGFRLCRLRIWHLIFDHLTPSENFSLSFSHLIRGGKKYDIKNYFMKIMKKIHPMFSS